MILFQNILVNILLEIAMFIHIIQNDVMTFILPHMSHDLGVVTIFRFSEFGLG